jgi:16S rRNA (cytosine1402-N4)-methyltransferase
VLVQQVVEALAPVQGDVIIDGTYGAGGYSRAVLAVADCRIIAVDRDPDAMARAWAHAGADPRLKPAPGRFGELDAIAHAVGHDGVNGVMLDLGVSSPQLDQAERGFSFMRDGPLDMRMERQGPSAADAVNQLSEGHLADIFRLLGEEPMARRFARAIVRRRAERPFTTTLDLADAIEHAAGGRQGKRTHPATRVFQALRIFVNDELGELAHALSSAERALKSGGRVVIVTFHSLEDRMVKTFLRDRSGNTPGVSRHLPGAVPEKPRTFELIERKAIEPPEAETAVNPRARSARLRWAIRTENPAWPEPVQTGLRLPDLGLLESAA